MHYTGDNQDTCIVHYIVYRLSIEFLVIGRLHSDMYVESEF